MYPNSTDGGRGGVVYYGLLGSKICEFMIILLSDTSRPSEKNGNTIFSLEGNLEGLSITIIKVGATLMHQLYQLHLGTLFVRIALISHDGTIKYYILKVIVTIRALPVCIFKTN